MSEKHPGIKEIFLDGIAWLCETPKTSFAFGLGLGLLVNSTPIIFLIPFFLLQVLIGRGLRKLQNEEKIQEGSIPAFMFGCVAGIFSGAIIFAILFEYSGNSM